MKTNEQKRETEQKAKLALILLGLLLSAFILFRVVYTFFVGIAASGEGSELGAPEIILGEPSFSQNGVPAAELGNKNALLENLNPGDVFVVSYPFENLGASAAWVRGELVLYGSAVEADAAAFQRQFSVYEGALTSSQLAAGGSRVALAERAGRLGWFTPAAVAEGASKGVFSFTIYFEGKNAANEWQGRELGLEFGIAAEEASS